MSTHGTAYLFRFHDSLPGASRAAHSRSVATYLADGDRRRSRRAAPAMDRAGRPAVLLVLAGRPRSPTSTPRPNCSNFPDRR